uniref:Uncharacterized protein n=1 Tax=Solanum tuberosum TaxID=4113 RepID=M1BKU1_SOLTU
MFVTKEMANEGDVNAASTTNVRLDGERKNHKGKKHHKSSEEMLLNPTPSETLTSHPHSTTEASDDDRGEEPIDVTPGEEWIARVEKTRQVVEILGRHLNKVDGKFKTEDFTLEENDHIRKELECRQRAEIEMKEAITSLECRLMEAFDGKKIGRQGDTERKTDPTKRNGCYICGGMHGYAMCPELKRLGAILQERKEKDAYELGQGAETMQQFVEPPGFVTSSKYIGGQTQEIGKAKIEPLWLNSEMQGR